VAILKNDFVLEKELKMRNTWIILLVFLLVACGGESQSPTVTVEPSATEMTVVSTETPVPTPTLAVTGAQITPMLEMPQPAAFEGLDLPTERGEFFATAGVCTNCHTKNIDGEGHDVSIDSFWRGTMMANSARDPYWQASVRGETLAHPELDSVIQDTCTTCHTPMARTTRKFEGGVGEALDNGFLDPENELHALGIDGTSCTLCHQIEADKLGEHESFEGGYVIDEALPTGERLNHGPYDVAEDFANIMQSTSGYIPQQGAHIQTSEKCATCHTLFTPTIDNNGEVAGLFPEQTPYLEWLASDFADVQSCQDCHMPEAPGQVVLSVTGGPERSPFSRHSFVGGNTYALSLLRNFGGEMDLTASSTQIDAALNRAHTQLREQTAQIRIDRLDLSESTLKADVVLSHQVGHKFPSGFPSRRVWIHLTVFDSQGKVVFESGNWAADGSIVGNDNDLESTTYEPHYQVVDNSEQVQIYEAIIGDVDDAVTTILLRGAGYLKDNRLLPGGFDKEHAEEDIAVHGDATNDADFQAGGDLIVYQIDVAESSGPFTVVVELLYQSIGYRWAQNLKQYQAPEPERFLSYYEALPNIPVVVASDVAEVGE
jgi:hypothetical protein